MHNPHGLTAIPAESQRWDRLTQAKWKVESHFQVFMYFFFLSTMAYTNTYNIRTVQTVSVLYSWIDYDKICSILFCFFFVHIFHRHRLFGVWAKCYTIHLLLARRWTFFFSVNYGRMTNIRSKNASRNHCISCRLHIFSCVVSAQLGRVMLRCSVMERTTHARNGSGEFFAKQQDDGDGCGWRTIVHHLSRWVICSICVLLPSAAYAMLSYFFLFLFDNNNTAIFLATSRAQLYSSKFNGVYFILWFLHHLNGSNRLYELTISQIGCSFVQLAGI